MTGKPKITDAEIRKVMDDAQLFAARNLCEGADELLEWGRTAVLRDGVVRELARMVETVGREQSLSIAESMFKGAALTAAQQQGQARPPSAPAGVEGAVDVDIPEPEGLEKVVRDAVAAWEECRSPMEAQAAMYEISNDLRTNEAARALAQQPEPKPEARGGGEVVPDGYTSYGEFRWACDCNERQRREWTPVYLAPPSAPVVDVGEIMHNALCRIALGQEPAQTIADDAIAEARKAALAQQPAARPPKPTECMNGCPDRQVCDHCQWPPGPDQQPAAVDEAKVSAAFSRLERNAYGDPRTAAANRSRDIRTIREVLATQHQEPKS